MATKSSTAAITNHDAGTPNQDAILTKAKVVAIPFTTEKVAGNTDGDQIQFARVHSDWCLTSLKFNNDALTGATDVNVGLWTDEAPDDASAVAENCYCDAISFGSALAFAEQAFEGRDLAAMGQKVWEDAGLSARPEGGAWYRMALNLVTGGTAAGTISGIAEFALPS